MTFKSALENLKMHSMAHSYDFEQAWFWLCFGITTLWHLIILVGLL